MMAGDGYGGVKVTSMYLCTANAKNSEIGLLLSQHNHNGLAPIKYTQLNTKVLYKNMTHYFIVKFYC